MSAGDDDGATDAPSGDFFRAVADHIAHPIFVKNRAFNYVFVNRAMSVMTGFDAQKMLGKTDYDFFPKSEADFFRHKDEEMFATMREVVIDEEPLTDALGGKHVLATTKVPIFGPDGEIKYLAGIIHDITRLKIAEEDLRRANALLEERVLSRTRALEAAQADLVRKERLAVLGLLAGGVAHQIRNPLASIKTAAHVLAHATEASEVHEVKGVKETIAIIQEEVQRANGIVTDLLDYARVRSPDKKRISAAYLVEQALGAYECPKGVTVYRALAELPDALVDAQQVQGALANLVRNAFEAVGAVGVISVSLERHESEVIIRIANTGPRIGDDVRAHLFEPLFTTKSTGLGLGLVTARALVENQGGKLTHVDLEGPGAEFEVRLPLAAPKQG